MMSHIAVILSLFFWQFLDLENTPDYITPGGVENHPTLCCLSDVNVEMSYKHKNETALTE